MRPSVTKRRTGKWSFNTGVLALKFSLRFSEPQFPYLCSLDTLRSSYRPSQQNNFFPIQHGLEMPSISHWRSILGSETTCSRLEELRNEYWGERGSGLFGYRQQSTGVAGILLPQHQSNSFYVILKIICKHFDSSKYSVHCRKNQVFPK